MGQELGHGGQERPGCRQTFTGVVSAWLETEAGVLKRDATLYIVAVSSVLKTQVCYEYVGIVKIFRSGLGG